MEEEKKVNNLIFRFINEGIDYIRSLSFIIQSLCVYSSFLGFLIIVSIIYHLKFYENFLDDHNSMVYFNLLIKNNLLNQTDLLLMMKKLTMEEDTNTYFKSIEFIKIYNRELINNNLILTQESIISNITKEFSKKIFEHFDNNSDFLIDDKFLNLFNYNGNYINIDNINYFLGDLIKLYYIFYPLIYDNAFFNNVEIKSGFITMYMINNNSYIDYKKNNFKNLPSIPYYFQYPISPIRMDYVNKGYNFEPQDYNLDPVPYIYSKNITNFNIKDNWYTYYDYLNLYDYNRIEIYRVSNIFTTDYYTRLEINEITAPFTTFNSIYNNSIKIFVSIGFLLKKQDHLQIEDQIDFFQIINLYQNSSDISFFDDFQNYNSSYTNLTNDTKTENLNYFSFDNSTSVIVETPAYFLNFYRYGMQDNIHRSFIYEANINPLTVNKLRNYFSQYSVNFNFKSDSIFLNIVYLANLQYFYSDAIWNNPSFVINSSNLLNATQNICKNMDLSNYYNNLKSNSDIDCFTDQELNKMNKYFINNSINQEIGFNQLPSCYCIPFLCLNNDNKTEIFEIFNNKSTKFNKTLTIIPNQCSINFLYLNQSILMNNYRLVAFHFPLTVTKTSNVVILFIVNDYDSIDIYNDFNNKIQKYYKYFILIYTLLTFICFIYFVIRMKTKLYVIKEKLDYIGSNYFDIINYNFRIENLKDLNKKDSELLKNMEKNCNENEDNFTEIDPINNKSVMKIRSIRHRSTIFTKSLKEEIIAKNEKSKIKIKDFENENDELEDIHTIIKDNLDRFEIDFDLDKVFNNFAKVTNSSKTSFKNKKKINYVFGLDDNFTTNQIDNTLILMKEAEITNFYSGYKLSRNLLFKYAMNYINNNENFNYDNTNDDHSLNKTISGKNFHEQRESDNIDINLGQNNNFFKSIYILIESSLTDLEYIDYNKNIMNKFNIRSIIHFYFDNVFIKWLRIINYQRKLSKI